MLEIIVGGLTVIANVTTILQYRHTIANTTRQPEAVASLGLVQEQVVALKKEAAKPPSMRNEEALKTAYNALLQSLKGNNLYTSQIEFRPTTYGTLRVVRKRKRTVIGRDDMGEYGATF